MVSMVFCVRRRIEVSCVKNQRGATKIGLGLSDIKSLYIRVPSLSEQNEIVRILNVILENEKSAQELSDTINKIDHMKKPILARAFRGELGTNDPSEESAMMLINLDWQECYYERI